MFRKALPGLIVTVVLGLCQAAPAASQNAQAKASLNRVLPAINFTNVTLRDAVDFLRDVSGANIHANWKAIEAAGVTADTTINVKLRSVTLRKVLGLVLSEASGGVGLTFYIDEGVVEITTSEIADQQMFTIVYPVQDLLVEPPDFIQPPDFDLSQSQGRSAGGGGGGRGGGGGGGGQGQGLFGNSTSGNSSQQQQRDPKAKADELIQLIVDTVTPNIWVQNGGKATIRIFNGNLVITAPRSVHEQIGGPID
jgi:hypothetical protein